MSRARSFGRLPWASEGARDPSFIPLQLKRDRAMGWYWKVRFWQAVCNIQQGGSDVDVGSVLFSFNQTNNHQTSPLNITPTTENQLPFGWQMEFDAEPLSIAGSLSFLFFNGRLGTSGFGGAQYELDDIESDIAPFIVISGSIGSTEATGDPEEPNVTVTLDGEQITYYADPSAGISGTIAIDPFEWWPYELTAGGGAIYDISDGHELMDPRQTDELPSTT